MTWFADDIFKSSPKLVPEGWMTMIQHDLSKSLEVDQSMYFTYSFADSSCATNNLPIADS